MSLPVKLGVSTIALGSAIGIGYGGFTYFSQENKETSEGKSIKSLIDEKFEYVLLSFAKGETNADEVIWKQNWETYKSENSKRDIDILGVKGWTKDTASESTEELKAKCKELSEKIVYDKGSANYESVTKYCGRVARAGDEASRKGLKIITGTGENIWKSKTDKKDELAPKWKALGFEGTDFTATNLNTKCEEAKKKERKSDGYATFYEAYESVCTNPSGA